ncbi:gluconate 2-dehydrogenase subunit 3 family protein [Paenibacillus mendelii]|uniref:Gluconate 2-dehydrogenase subunit 3 family protein n=1 Tax=Paenibacillus mendelii TaxID=206163 RepID=A0ABV6JG18_9BACL|nr:gluconate 2-dehydrogenase subunit 3 family protein [Paenibacillus mendelii]MCQ6562442.1 gluconate 2-dehydrogenase subunit 3 family protein [Paenibacillus mendelii]
MENNDEHKEPAKQDVQEPSRRRFLVNAGFAIGGVVVGGALGSIIGRKAKEPAAPEPAPTEEKPAVPANYNRALMFFNQEQFSIVDAATERIFPKDANGPGAKELGVAFFIDHQLAGDYGFNGREYMSPPYFKGEKVQGYQGHLKRREMYDIALQEMENYSQAQFQKGFSQLAGEQQDEVLKAFEEDAVEITTISPSGFFKILRSNTLEGVYSDPLYGGNANMDGWRMRNYPGNQMSFTSIIDKDFKTIAPSSLQDHMAAK